MNPTVVAAWIAAGVSVLTLIGTLAAQYLGRRGTAKDTDKAFAEQREQLNETLKAQSEQLDRTIAAQNTQLDRTFEEQRKHLDLTLAAQGEQLDLTLAEQRTRTFNERFGAGGRATGQR